ncbi:hypothetical protein TIFTF001_050354 [Ficus carica]|uniref:V-SNARE coiled-coil homology domain-containing protein n=1 Tax=Ficus carica TaxID=3494 RepID=A0AA87YWD0_FICCA|nr:hypothetical protein TIFTF001_050354 [Ficus carica]
MDSIIVVKVVIPKESLPQGIEGELLAHSFVAPKPVGVVPSPRHHQTFVAPSADLCRPKAAPAPSPPSHLRTVACFAVASHYQSPPSKLQCPANGNQVNLRRALLQAIAKPSCLTAAGIGPTCCDAMRISIMGQRAAVIVGRQEMWRGRAIWDTVQDFHALTGIPITSLIISLIIGSEDKAVEASQYVAPAHQLILPRDMVEEKLQQQSKLKEHMQYCVDHPEEISKLAKVKAQVSEVKGVMMENIEKVLDRGEKIELLVDKMENLPTSFHLSIFNCFGNEEWQRLNVPSNHPGPTLTSNEDPPPPPAPAAVC